MNHIPAGYLNLGNSIMHAAEVRHYTADIERFKRHLPLMLELDGVEPKTPEAQAIYERIDDIQQFALSLKEFGALSIAEGEKLMRVIGERQATAGGADFDEDAAVADLEEQQIEQDIEDAAIDADIAAGGADDENAQCERCHESTEDFRPVIVECGGSESTVNTCSNCLTELYGPNWRELAAGGADQ